MRLSALHQVTESRMPSLPPLVLAVELLGDLILPSLSIADLVHLGQTCKALAGLLLLEQGEEAERVWKNRIKQDLRFPMLVVKLQIPEVSPPRQRDVVVVKSAI